MDFVRLFGAFGARSASHAECMSQPFGATFTTELLCAPEQDLASFLLHDLRQGRVRIEYRLDTRSNSMDMTASRHSTSASIDQANMSQTGVQRTRLKQPPIRRDGVANHDLWFGGARAAASPKRGPNGARAVPGSRVVNMLRERSCCHVQAPTRCHYCKASPVKAPGLDTLDASWARAMCAPTLQRVRSSGFAAARTVSKSYDSQGLRPTPQRILWRGPRPRPFRRRRAELGQISHAASHAATCEMRGVC